jgi:CBS domain-containing protein
MNLQQILQHKGSTVYKTSPRATLADVVAQLVKHNCGSLVVCEGEEMVGIITERDILRACAANGSSLAETSVERSMSRRVVTGSPQDEVETVMGLMTKNRIRHMPVLEQGKLVGMISIGDVVKAHHDSLCLENHYLKSYLQG